jgi:MarR family transcriptional regulator, transcriptional regulator for hemolysin
MHSVAGEQSIGHLLADISRLIRKLADRRLAAIGLTRAQCHALMSLKRLGPLTQSTLADIMDIETATVARLIARLEIAGWVKRTPDDRDRRVKVVSTTDKAAAIMDQISEIAESLAQEMTADLSQRHLDALVNSLGGVKRRVAQLLRPE